MRDKTDYTCKALFDNACRRYSDRPALSFTGETPLTYKDLDRKIKALIAFLEKVNIEKGERVAILSNNTPNWAICYLSINFMRAVVVPLLPGFNEDEIEKVLSHAGAKAVFVSEKLLPKIENTTIDTLEHIFRIEDFSVFKSSKDSMVFDENEVPRNSYYPEEDDLASIIYTSGTTGRPKGVMLSQKNICFTAIKGSKIQAFDQNDRFLSVLPLSHAYEKTLGLMIPLFSGACVYYLEKAPTASNLLHVMNKVKPTAMLTVPLIMEKIYRNRVLPTFQKNPIIAKLYKIPLFRKILHRIAGRKLMNSFGGSIRFFGIGGSKINATVERFLREAKFPYAIGYGLTEASPLLAGSNPQNTAYQSTGPAMEGVSLKIVKEKVTDTEGEIWAKGENIMKGYYRDDDLTRSVITEDGWLKTGDKGLFDKKNNLYIKGRIKNVIIGPNGENIYPEEIESLINDFKYVNESLVLEKKGKIVALVYFNHEELEKKYQTLKEDVINFVERKVGELQNELHNYINEKVNNFSKVQMVIRQPIPFEKTPTNKIKRFLYQ